MHTIRPGFAALSLGYDAPMPQYARPSMMPYDAARNRVVSAIQPTLQDNRGDDATALAPPRTPPPRRASRRARGQMPRRHQLQILARPLLEDLTNTQGARGPLARRYARALMPYLASQHVSGASENASVVRTLFVHAIVGFSVTPATFFELFNSLYPGAALSVRDGGTLAHALAYNTLASEEQKLSCLRQLASLGVDLAAEDADGDTCAIVASRQAYSPLAVLSAIQAWDERAFTDCSRQGYSVADALLANPVPHPPALWLALSSPTMCMNPTKPRAWQPPPLPLNLAHYLASLVAKPWGAVGPDGLLLSAL